MEMVVEEKDKGTEESAGWRKERKDPSLPEVYKSLAVPEKGTQDARSFKEIHQPFKRQNRQKEDTLAKVTNLKRLFVNNDRAFYHR